MKNYRVIVFDSDLWAWVLIGAVLLMFALGSVVTFFPFLASEVLGVLTFLMLAVLCKYLWFWAS